MITSWVQSGFGNRMAARFAVLASLFLVATISALGLTLPEERFSQALSLLLLAAVAVACALLMVREPPIALAALVLLGLLFRPEIGTGSTVALNAAFLMAPLIIGIWLLEMIRRKDGTRLIRSPVTLSLGVFMFLALLSFAFGQYPWFPAPGAPIRAQLGGLGVFLFSGGVFLVSAHQLQDLRWLRRIVFLFLAVGAVHIGLWSMPGLGRLASPYLPGTATSSMFWTWFAAMGAGQALANTDLRPVWRVWAGILVLASLWTGIHYMQAWLSGWVPALIAVGIVAAIRAPVPCLAGGLAAAVVAAFNFDAVVAFMTAGDQPYSLMTRDAAMQSLVPILSANPLMGTGPANYYYFTPLFPILGWYVKFSSHNNYIDILAQLGILGLLAFLWFYFALGKLAWNLRQAGGDGFCRGYVYGVVGGMVGSLVAMGLGDWLLPFVYNIGLPGFRASVLAWMFMGGIPAIDQVLRRQEAPQ